MRTCLLLGLSIVCAAAEKYTGPRPPKPDVPYLLHANKLVETELTEAKDQQVKDNIVYTINGASSPAKTPMAEPIFLLESEKLNPAGLELYRLDTKNGSRQITMPGSARRAKNAPRPLRLSVQKLEGKLYRIEAAEGLENGQYSLSPSDSNKAFCFEVF